MREAITYRAARRNAYRTAPHGMMKIRQWRFDGWASGANKTAKLDVRMDVVRAANAAC